MRINKLKINAYGKLKDKNINLGNNINIIYGKNESGKSTILKFIINSFYGASRNKKGKDISDYERYTPWETEEFSGKIQYELDDGKKLEVFREFKKKNPKIYNELSEDISKEFNIDKNKGNEFFYEQTKIDEATFLSTAIIEQQEVKIEKNIQNNLIQKISNLITTGEDNISYEKAIEKINKKQLEEIGTERSREKPINVIEAKLEEINSRIKDIEQYGYQGKEIEEKILDLANKTLHNHAKMEILQDVNKLRQEEKIEEEKIKINEKIKNDYQEKISLLKNDVEKIKNENKNHEKINLKNNLEKNKKIIKKINLIFILLLIIDVLSYFLIKNTIIKNILVLTAPMILIFYYFLKNNKKNKIKKEEKNNLENNKIIENKLLELKNEINLIEKNKIKIENEIEKIKKEINYKNKNKIEKIKNNYYEKMKTNKNDEKGNLIFENENQKQDNQKFKNEIDEILNYTFEEINIELHKTQNEITKDEIEIANLKIQKRNNDDVKTELNNLEETKVMLTKKHEELCKKNASMNIAKSAIQQAYEHMKNSISPKFTENLSKLILDITKGKHKSAKINDEKGIVVELEKGNYVNINRLSIGTIDQLYLSLRLAILEEISEEKIPIILDEAFAYYDDERLENILKYLHEKFNNRQIIIFTCTNREKNILNKLNVDYNLVVL